MLELSPRERECLLWAARGKTYTEMGLIIGISFGTVKSYLDHARFKLNCATLPQATAAAVARGIFTGGDLWLEGGHDQTDAQLRTGGIYR